MRLHCLFTQLPLPMLFLNCLILDIVERGRRFGDVPICVSFIDQVHLSEDMIAEALVLRTECMHEEKCSLNFGGYAIRVMEELFSMNLPDLCPEGLSAPVVI